jgi:site-specific DNA recombinase
METQYQARGYFEYNRKSSEAKERQILSIESQHDSNLGRFPDIPIVDRFKDEKSAFIPENRPEFDRMIKLINDGRADGILAYHPNRLARNAVEAGMIVYMIRLGKINDLKFSSYTFDNSPEGIMMLQLAMSQAEYESAKSSKDIRRGMQTKFASGWLPGHVPSGYLNSGPTTEKGSRYIKKDPQRWGLVRKAWDLFLTGSYTVPQIYQIAANDWKLTQRKTKRRGGGPISRTSWYGIFNSVFYTGYYNYLDKDGNEIFKKGRHEAMITLEEYDQAQRLLGKRGRTRLSAQPDLSYMGLMKCGECSCSITGEVKEKSIKSLGITRQYIYYHCSHKRKDYKCKQKPIRKEALEIQFESEINKYTILPEFRDLALRLLRRAHSDEIQTRTQMYESRHAALVQAQARLDRLIDMRADGDLSDEDYLRKSGEYKSEVLRCQELLRDTEVRAEQWVKLTEETFEFATYAHHAFMTGDDENKKRVIRTLGYNLTLKDKVLQLEAKKWLIPIAEGYPELEAKYLEVITSKNPSTKDKTAALATVSSQWWS